MFHHALKCVDAMTVFSCVLSEGKFHLFHIFEILSFFFTLKKKIKFNYLYSLIAHLAFVTTSFYNTYSLEKYNDLY